MSVDKQKLEDLLRSSLPADFKPDLPVETLIGLIVYNLVVDPSDVTISVKGRDGVVAVELEVGARNKGRVIGKNGHLIKSLRSLCRGIEKGRGRDVILDLVGWEDDGSY